jgi:hypothetical protein
MYPSHLILLGDKYIQNFSSKIWRKDTTSKETTRRWEDNIKMHLKESVYEDVEGIQLAQYFCTAINFPVP